MSNLLAPARIAVTKPRDLSPLAVGSRDAARLLGLSERTVQTLVRCGQLPSIQPAGHGGRRLFRVASLDQWLIEREKAQAAETGAVHDT